MWVDYSAVRPKNFLIQRRDVLKLTRPQAAKALGVSTSTIQRWELESEEVPTTAALALAYLLLLRRMEDTFEREMAMFQEGITKDGKLDDDGTS